MSNCSCEYVYDFPEFHHIRRPIAKKGHICTECFGEIKPGERYEYVTGKWGGVLDTFKTCAHCLLLRDHLIATRECYCWAYGGLQEEVFSELSHGEFRPGERFRLLSLIAQIKKEKASNA